jgi:transposase-like protein
LALKKEVYSTEEKTLTYTALASVMRYTKLKYKYFPMKSYSVALREKIVAAPINKNFSIRKVANLFSVSKSLVQKLVKQQKLAGNLQPKPRGNHNLVL